MSLHLTTNRPDSKDAVVVPTIPLILLEYLKLMFPDRAPTRGEALADIRHKAGQVSVVRHLAEHYRAQNENVLSSPAKTSRVPSK